MSISCGVGRLGQGINVQMFAVNRDRWSVIRLLVIFFIGLLIYSAWGRGGVYPPWQWPLVSISAILLGGIYFLERGLAREIKRTFFRDPVFYLGLTFLVVLFFQSLNSGYAVMWDKVETVGMNELPSKWLPWSVEPKAAAQMFNWFFPVWTVLLMVRHVFTYKHIRLLLHCMVWGAAILAVVGIIQQLFGAQKVLGLWEIPSGRFFATFGYVNHAGAYFYLHAALAAGLAHHSIKHHMPPAQIIVWVACFMLCLFASFFSLSRAAGMASLVLVAAAVGAFIRWDWQRSKGNQIVNRIGVACIVALTGAVLYFGAGGGALAQEIEDTFLGERMEGDIKGRTQQLPSAWQISKDYPVFGCGGWGYRWVALLHIPVNEWDLWRNPGLANVHCDPLQFLCEFGWVGFLLMSGVVGRLIFDISKRWKKNSRGQKNGTVSVLSCWIGLGLLLVFLHSWIDFLFRCPAILIAWCTLLAVVPKLLNEPDDWEGYAYE